jgi:hypothetical protein
MPGRCNLPSSYARDERRDCLFDLGIGREAPKELREPRLSFMDGESERFIMYGDASAVLFLVAGTSTGPESPLLPLVLTLVKSLDLTECIGTPKSLSSKAGMVIGVERVSIVEFQSSNNLDREQGNDRE